MVGDDVVSDVGGAQKAGIRGVLVRTGKFRYSLELREHFSHLMTCYHRPGVDEPHHTVKPDLVVDNLAALIDTMLSKS